MAAFTFIVRQSGGTWIAKQHCGGAGALEACSDSTWELQRKLTSLALASAGTGVVSSSFTLITPTSAIAQVIVTGADGVPRVSALPASSGAAAAVPAPEAPPEVNKDEAEEDTDDEGGLGGLFD